MTLVSRLWRSKIAQLFIQTFIEWQKDDCLKMGAALAYYALFSFFPFILVLLSIFGWLVGPESQLKSALSAIARDSLPKDAFPIVVTTLAQLNQGSTKAGIIGFILLLLSASGFFSALDDALDHIWNVRHRPQQSFNLFRAIRAFLQQKLIAFSLVLAATLFIQLTLFANVAVGIFLQIVNQMSDRMDLPILDSARLLLPLQITTSFLILFGLLMMLYRFLPATRIFWKDVWCGALIASGLLLCLQQGVSNSVISFGSNFQSYGVIGGVMVLMVWMYLTSQIIFFGGEMTFVFCYLWGSRRGITR